MVVWRGAHELRIGRLDAGAHLVKLFELGCLLLDATPWADLPFVETETLHHKPAR